MFVYNSVFQGDLILSDEMNHVSLILGMRLSGATCQTFAHNGKKKRNEQQSFINEFFLLIRYEKSRRKTTTSYYSRSSTNKSSMEKDYHRR